MRIWRATRTLDGLIDDLDFTGDPLCADVLLVGGKTFSLDQFPQLQGIFKTGIGTDNLPFDRAKSRGIQIRLPSDHTQEIVYTETAAFACQLILRSLYRHVGELDSWTKYHRSALSSKQVLVIGCGNIGSKVQNSLSCLCHVETFDAVENQPHELETFVRRADCVTLHIPLDNHTRNFVDAEKLKWMKNGASLINTSRGSIVNEDALYEELAVGRLFACFDVFWEEPYDGKLRALHPDPFYMTPHVASTCREFLEGTARDFRQFLQELES